MDRLAAALGKWIRRYGLAAACLILPWSMPNTWPAQMLMPWQKGDFAFAFRFASPATTPHTAEVATSPSEPNVTTKQDITPDSLFVQHLSNRVPFALVTGYFYLAAATVLVFSSIIIMHYLGCASLLCAMVGYGIAAYALIFISPQQKPFNFELSLAVSDLLDKADKEAILSPLAIPGGGIF